MRVAVAGSTGFLGKKLVRRLVASGVQTVALVRSSDKIETMARLGSKPTLVDYRKPETLEQALAGTQVVFNLVGASAQSPANSFEASNVEPARNLAAAAVRAGVEKIVYNSGLGVNPDNTLGYFVSKAECEEIIKSSSLSFLIFRPSYIVGPGDEFSDYIYGSLLAGREIAVFGTGEYRMQPLFIEDALNVYESSLKLGSVWDRVYDLVGPDRVSFREYVQLVAKELGTRASFRTVDLELALKEAMIPIAYRRENTALSVDELCVLLSDFVSDPTPLERDFGLTVTPLEQTVKRTVKAYI